MKESLYIFLGKKRHDYLFIPKRAKNIDWTIILKTEKFRVSWVSLKAFFGKYRILILSPPFWYEHVSFLRKRVLTYFAYKKS